ncbi:MAG: TVP38/TMEM64 family protein [Candidatus Babeliales bacterium]
MNAVQKRFLIGFSLLLLVLVVRFSGIHHYITLERIKEQSHILEYYIQRAYLPSVFMYIGILAALVACAIPVSFLLTIASGYFFGAIPGACYSIIGSTLGATISFFVFRYLLRASVQKKYGHLLEKFNQEFKKRGASYLLFLQLLPVTPYGVIIVISSLSALSWWVFVWTTAIGIAPGSFIFAFAGRQFMSLSSTADVLSWPVLLSLLMLALFALLPLIVDRFKR